MPQILLLVEYWLMPESTDKNPMMYCYILCIEIYLMRSSDLLLHIQAWSSHQLDDMWLLSTLAQTYSSCQWSTSSMQLDLKACPVCAYQLAQQFCLLQNHNLICYDMKYTKCSTLKCQYLIWASSGALFHHAECTPALWANLNAKPITVIWSASLNASPYQPTQTM